MVYTLASKLAWYGKNSEEQLRSMMNVLPKGYYFWRFLSSLCTTVWDLNCSNLLSSLADHLATFRQFEPGPTLTRIGSLNVSTLAGRSINDESFNQFCYRKQMRITWYQKETHLKHASTGSISLVRADLIATQMEVKTPLCELVRNVSIPIRTLS